MDELIENNMKLAYSVAYKYKYNAFIEVDDLIGLALYGLVKAARSFNPSKGTVFATYACRVMHNEIKELLRKHRLQAQHYTSLRSFDYTPDDDDRTLDHFIPYYQDLTEIKVKQFLDNLTPYELQIIRLLESNKGNATKVARILGRERSVFHRYELKALRDKAKKFLG